MSEHHVPEAQCPNCKLELDWAVNADKYNEPPKNGDVSVCFKCHTILIWEDNKLRMPNDKEMYDIAGNKKVLKALRLLKKVREDIKQTRKEA